MEITPIDGLMAKANETEKMKGHINEWRRMLSIQEEVATLQKESNSLTEKIELAKVATTAVLAHGMILTSCSYVLSWIGMDPVVDVSSTIVKEIVAPLVVYLGTNTIMNIFEKNKLSFSVPINSTVISKDGTTHKASDDEAVG